jgi:FkbM family methyltransferase
MKISMGDVTEALALIGKNPEAREIMIDALRRIDAALTLKDREVREVVTGPLLDALHDVGSEVTKVLNDGTTFKARYTSKIIRDLIFAPEHPDHVWEPQTTRTAIHFARDARHVLVGGAYIGDHAVLMAKVLAPGGKVHCFEPSTNADMLERNAKANGLDNVVVNRVGLWSDDCHLILVGSDSHAHPEVVPQNQAGAFPAVSINAYGERASISSLALILLDIEGGELPTLTGASRYLSMPSGEAPAILFEVHRSYTDWTNGLEQTPICMLLKKHGYTLFALRDYNSNVPMANHPVELIPAADVWLEGPPHGFNMLATKKPSDLENTGFKIVRGVSPKLLKHRDPRFHAPIH